jgi:peroxiredoxin
MTLQDRLDAFKADFEVGKPPYSVPPSVIAAMHRATAELIASGAADRALRTGTKAPDFKLLDSRGVEVSSSALLAKGALVVSFYRGVWCPYCNLELQALEATLPEIEKHGATLLAISPQTQVNSRRSVRDNNVTFPILSDPHNDVAAAFGLRFKLPDYLIEIYKTVGGIDLTVINADDSWTLPMPARSVIAPDGTIIYAEVNPDYTKRPDPCELLPVLERLATQQAA